MERRVGLRSLTIVGGLAVVVVAVASGATSTVKPYTAFFSAGPVGAGSSVVVDLVLTNLSSQQTLGSADVSAATRDGTSFEMTGASTGDTSGFPTLLKLRNLGIAPMASRTISISVKTPCAPGDYTWGIRAKQSNNFSGPPGNDFTFQADESNLVTSVSGGCKLVWVTQPKSTNINTLITGVPYDPSGSKVTVEAVDGAGNPLTSASGTVTLNMTGGEFTSAGTGFTGTTAAMVGGTATFGSVKSDRAGSGFVFYASSPGFDPTPNSDPFNISLVGVVCTPGEDCELPQTQLDNQTQVSATGTGGSFTFLGIGPAAIPSAVTGAAGGCEGFKSLGVAAFEETSGRTSNQGELRFTYWISKKSILKRYGANSGQQFIPLCAGAAWLDGQGVAKECDAPGSPTAWIGKELDADGKFTGRTKSAVCDPMTGLFWGVLGSFQDSQGADPIDPATSPTVTGWDSDSTYRFFSIRVPSPWDWKNGG